MSNTLNLLLTELEAEYNKLTSQIQQGVSYYIDDTLLGKVKQEKLMLKNKIDHIKSSIKEEA